MRGRAARMKECVECRKKFKPNAPNQLYCSKQCRAKVVNRRRWQRRKVNYQKKRMELINLLGGRCSACGTADPLVLTIDHINNDGKGKKNSRDFIERMLKKPQKARETLQVLCWNHNAMKFFHPEEFQFRFPQLFRGKVARQAHISDDEIKSI